MGQPEQFTKQRFAEETFGVTGGGAEWKGPVELGLSEVRLDGLLVVHDAAALLALPPPWSEVARHDQIVVELKMPGDHLDPRATGRALLRRQAHDVKRLEDSDGEWDDEAPLWVVAPHVPEGLRRRRTLTRVGPGCYRVDPASFSFLWIAANELPLDEALVPFLQVRSGRPFEEFARWLAERRSPHLLLRMLELFSMSAAVYEEILRFALQKSEDPEIRDRQRRMIHVLLDMTPEVRDEEHEKEARKMLLRVLARRGLTPSDAEQTRVNACADLLTLERWLEQAAVATSVAEALA